MNIVQKYKLLKRAIEEMVRLMLFGSWTRVGCVPNVRLCHLSWKSNQLL